MRLLPVSQPLRARALCALRGAARFGSASPFSSSTAASPAAAFDSSSALERQRERRRKERAEPQPTIGIEGTTEFYTRQLVVVDPDASAPVTWAKKIEFSDHIVASYVKALVATGGNPKSSPLRTIAATPFPAPCASRSEHVPEEDVASRKHDLLVFPDNIRVHNVELSHIPSLVTKLVEPNPNVHGVLADLNLTSTPLAKGHHILVCAHESRDERCGCNGPKLLRWLQDVGAQRNVPVHLYSSSHFGGHRYAANCIAYPSGDWFGLLNEPNDAAELISALEDKQPLRLHTQWRGRIALTKDEQILTLRNAVAAAETSE